MYNHFLGAAGVAYTLKYELHTRQIWYRYWVTRYSAGGLRPCSVGGSCCPDRSNSHRGSDSGGCNGSGCHGYQAAITHTPTPIPTLKSARTPAPGKFVFKYNIDKSLPEDWVMEGGFKSQVQKVQHDAA